MTEHDRLLFMLQHQYAEYLRLMTEAYAAPEWRYRLETSARGCRLRASWAAWVVTGRWTGTALTGRWGGKR